MFKLKLFCWFVVGNKIVLSGVLVFNSVVKVLLRVNFVFNDGSCNIGWLLVIVVG